MRKLFWQMNMTLDGFMEGPNRELDHTAHVVDDDFERYASAMLNSIDEIVIGRVTYELFAGYWPTAKGPDAERLNALPKTVFSRTLADCTWQNARIVREGAAEEVARMKAKPGRDIALFGSATLASELIAQGLIDEFRIFVTPVILGSGGAMFKNIRSPLPLELVKSETWSSGVAALCYRPRTRPQSHT